MSGDVALVGAFLDDHSGLEFAGSAYVYRFNGTTWIQEQKLTANDAAASDWFGVSVSVSGNVALVGAFTDDDPGPSSRSAYVFRFDGNTWNQEQRLIASDAAQNDLSATQYRYRVTWHSCQPIATMTLEADSGSAYVYRFNGSSWSQEQKLTASDAATDDRFGNSVSVSGEVVLVGAQRNGDAGSSSGSAYLFRCRGKVEFPDGQPVQNATVKVYEVVDGIVLVLDEEPVFVTGPDGTFSRPQAFLLRDQGHPSYVNKQLGILAELNHKSSPELTTLHNLIDPDVSPLVTNYPYADPLRPANEELPDLRGDETIFVPYPVITHPGLYSAADDHWNIAKVLRQDSTSPNTGTIENRVLPDGTRVPSFITFTVPSIRPGENDEDAATGADYPFRYNHLLPFTTDNYDEVNMPNFQGFLGEVRQALGHWVSNADALPLHIIGEGMGGVIARGWLSDNEKKEPAERENVARFVTLDTPHGGTALAAVINIKGLAQWSMNGYLASVLPVLGWNQFYKVTERAPETHLLVSTNSESVVENSLVSPNCSAFGSGVLTHLTTLVPTPSASRFIRGWEYMITTPHLSMNQDDDLLLTVGGFLRHGVRPAGVTLGPATASLSCEADPLSQAPTIVAFSETLSVAASSSATTTFAVDSSDSFEVFMTVGSEATVSIVAPDLDELLPVDVTQVDGLLLLRFLEDVGQASGSYQVSLQAGAESTTSTIVTSSGNGRYLLLSLPVTQIAVNDSVLIEATLLEIDDSVLIAPGTVDVTVSHPDGTSSVLVLDDSDNNGVFTASFAATAQGGVYSISAVAQLNDGPWIVQRTASRQFAVDNNDSELLSVGDMAVDVDGDAVIESIDLAVALELDLIGEYQLRGVLLSAQDEFILERATNLVIDAAGNYVASLSFPAEELALGQHAQPWRLSDIQLVALDHNLVIDDAPDHILARYDLTTFSVPGRPRVSAVVPDVGPLLGGNSVVIHGEHLGQVVAASIGGVPVLSLAVLGDTSLQIAVPASVDCSSLSVELALVQSILSVETTHSFRDAYTYGLSSIEDCDGNGIPDLCEVVLVPSLDVNGNGLLDSCEVPFVRGDCGADGSVGLTDALSGLSFLFLGGQVTCQEACDCNDDGQFGLADMIYLLNALFLGGPDPEAPFLACGLDTSTTTLACSSFPGCP